MPGCPSWACRRTVLDVLARERTGCAPGTGAVAAGAAGALPGAPHRHPDADPAKPAMRTDHGKPVHRQAVQLRHKAPRPRARVRPVQNAAAERAPRALPCKSEDGVRMARGSGIHSGGRRDHTRSIRRLQHRGFTLQSDMCRRPSLQLDGGTNVNDHRRLLFYVKSGLNSRGPAHHLPLLPGLYQNEKRKNNVFFLPLLQIQFGFQERPLVAVVVVPCIPMVIPP